MKQRFLLDALAPSFSFNLLDQLSLRLIDLRLTHQDIAEIIGAKRVTVTRLLSKFEQEGIIHRSCCHFILLR